jgi:hypothetical protein
MAEDEPVAAKSLPARPTLAEVAARMNAVIVAAREAGIPVPPDLARKTFVVSRKLARLTREREGGAR